MIVVEMVVVLVVVVVEHCAADLSYFEVAVDVDLIAVVDYEHLIEMFDFVRRMYLAYVVD